MTDFSHILQINCPNESFNKFISKYKNAFDKAFSFEICQNLLKGNLG